MPSVRISQLQFNLVLFVSIIILSLLSIVWHHQIYTLYKQIKYSNTQHHQIIALNKQLLSEHSQIMNGDEIKTHAINTLGMHEAQTKDFGKWYKGNLAL